jgi:hypothetical protein
MYNLAREVCEADDDAKIRETAYVAGIDYEGMWGLPIVRNAVTCGKLETLLAPHKDAFDVEAALARFEEKIMANRGTPRVGNEWSYAGYVEAGIFGLIFILQRNPNACAVFNNLDVDTKLDWYNIGLVWRKKELAGGTDEFISKMHQCKTRFIVVVLTLWTGERVLHANIIIYDTLNKVAERFDPYHDGIGNEDLLANVDSELELFFTRAFPDFSRLVRPPKKQLFTGIQTMQEGERDARQFDPPGYCQPFTFLYCECRLTFPDMDPIQVRDLMLEMAKRRSHTIGDFIRAYAECLQDNTLKLFTRFTKHKFDIDKARQLKDGSVDSRKIAMSVLESLNATGYGRPLDARRGLEQVKQASSRREPARARA